MAMNGDLQLVIDHIEDSLVDLKRINDRMELLSNEDQLTSDELRKELSKKRDEITGLKFRNHMLTEQYNRLITGDRAINRAMQIYVEMSGNPDYQRDQDLFSPQDLIDLMGWIFSGDADKYLKRIKEEWGIC